MISFISHLVVVMNGVIGIAEVNCQKYQHKNIENFWQRPYNNGLAKVPVNRRPKDIETIPNVNKSIPGPYAIRIVIHGNFYTRAPFTVYYGSWFDQNVFIKIRSVIQLCVMRCCCCCLLSFFFSFRLCVSLTWVKRDRSDFDNLSLSCFFFFIFHRKIVNFIRFVLWSFNNNWVFSNRKRKRFSFVHKFNWCDCE